MARSPARSCAAAATVTESEPIAVRSAPSLSSVSVADVSPSATVATAPMESPGTAVVSVKLAAVTPLAKAVLVSVTVTVALSKLASVNAAGFVALIAAAGVTTVIVKVNVAWSEACVLSSASDAVIVTVVTTSVLGVPQIVRANKQSPRPSASKESPVGSPLAE